MSKSKCSYSLEAEFDPSFDNFQAAVDAASELKLQLPETALQRLQALGVCIDSFVIYGNIRSAPATNKLYLPLRLEFSEADTALLAALRARDIDSIRHLALSLSPTTEVHSRKPNKR